MRNRFLLLSLLFTFICLSLFNCSVLADGHPVFDLTNNPLQIGGVYLNGPKVYDPKLPNAGNATFTFGYKDPIVVLEGYNPRLELFIRYTNDSNVSYDVAYLVNNINLPNPISDRIYSISWDGKWGKTCDNQNTINYGKIVSPCKLSVRLKAYINDTDTNPIEKAYNIYIVRLGIQKIEFTNDIPLRYHFSKATDINMGSDNDFFITSNWQVKNDSHDINDKGDIDDATGKSRLLPAIWPWLNVPEQDNNSNNGVEIDNFNRPACYRIGSKVSLNITMGYRAVSQINGLERSVGYPVLGCPIIKCQIFEGQDSFENRTFKDVELTSVGVPLSVQPDNKTIDGTVRLFPYKLKFVYLYKDANEWIKINGYQETFHNIYVVWDNPIFSTPWVKIVDRAIAWADKGTTKEIIARNMCNKMTPKTQMDDDQLNWYFKRCKSPVFEENWRHMTAKLGVIYEPTVNKYSEPLPSFIPIDSETNKEIIGGDCLACAEIMQQALAAMGIQSSLVCCNEKPEPNEKGEIFSSSSNIYQRLGYSNGSRNNWQGACKVDNICYSVQGGHIERYSIMNNAPSRVLNSPESVTQELDIKHAFNYYAWADKDNKFHTLWQPPLNPNTDASISNIR